MTSILSTTIRNINGNQPKAKNNSTETGTTWTAEFNSISGMKWKINDTRKQYWEPTQRYWCESWIKFHWMYLFYTLIVSTSWYFLLFFYSLNWCTVHLRRKFFLMRIHWKYLPSAVAYIVVDESIVSSKLCVSCDVRHVINNIPNHVNNCASFYFIWFTFTNIKPIREYLCFRQFEFPKQRFIIKEKRNIRISQFYHLLLLSLKDFLLDCLNLR